MASYVKIWTDIMNDEWFVGLTGLQRSFWLQLVIICKNGGDTGHIFRPSLVSLATEFGISRPSCERIVRSLVTSRTLLFSKSPKGQVHLELLNYHYYQRVKTPKDQPVGDQNRRSVSINNSTNKIRQYNIKEDNTKQNKMSGFAIANLEEKSKNVVQDYNDFLSEYSISIGHILSKEEYRELGDIDYILKHILNGTILNYIKQKPNNVGSNLEKYDKGEWISYIERWLKRNLKDLQAGTPKPSVYKEPENVTELPTRKKTDEDITEIVKREVGDEKSKLEV